MTSRTYCVWNPNAMGDGLVPDQGNLVITTGQSGLSNSRKVLGTIFKGVGNSNSEHEFWSTPQVSLGTNIAIGVAQPTSPLNSAVGADSLSFGFYPATGLVLSNGATVGTIDIVPERTVISLQLILDTGPALVIAINGSWRTQVALPSGKFWAFAATLAGGNAGETSLYSNFGQRGFNHPRISGPPV